MFLAGREGNGASGGQGRINCGAKVRLKRTKELHIKSYPSKDKITVSTAESERGPVILQYGEALGRRHVTHSCV